MVPVAKFAAHNKNIVFPELRKDDTYIYNLFFFCGYLKCVKSWHEDENLVCSLAVPNRKDRGGL